MAAHSEIIGNEVYIYMNGRLLMKRWISPNHERSVIFNKSQVYDKHTHRSITEVGGVIIDKINN